LQVNSAMETALLELNKHHDLALGEGGRYPSLYRLMANGNQQLRSLVSFKAVSFGELSCGLFRRDLRR